MKERAPLLRDWRLAVAVMIWGGAIAGGLFVAWRYEATPGPVAAAAPNDWPADVQLERSNERATLIMLVHPRCPCTRASISELSMLMEEVRGLADAVVLFSVPSKAVDGWERTETWDSASRIPGVRTVIDRNGELAARFGATVSGHTLVYDARGTKLFSGGITSARGHVGDNEGRSQIRRMLLDGATERGTTPTFGCDLEDDEQAKVGGT